MVATNSRSLVPKKWCTSAGSTPASAAIARIVAPPWPEPANLALAASRIAARLPLSPGRRPVRRAVVPGVTVSA